MENFSRYFTHNNFDNIIKKLDFKFKERFLK